MPHKLCCVGVSLCSDQVALEECAAQSVWGGLVSPRKVGTLPTVLTRLQLQARPRVMRLIEPYPHSPLRVQSRALGFLAALFHRAAAPGLSWPTARARNFYQSCTCLRQLKSLRMVHNQQKRGRALERSVCVMFEEGVLRRRWAFHLVAVPGQKKKSANYSLDLAAGHQALVAVLKVASCAGSQHSSVVLPCRPVAFLAWNAVLCGFCSPLHWQPQLTPCTGKPSQVSLAGLADDDPLRECFRYHRNGDVTANPSRAEP